MNIRTATLVIKCIIALFFLICGFWLTLLFSSAESKNVFLNNYHTYLGLGSFVLGILMAVGGANLMRMLLGFVLLGIGLFSFNYFLAFRDSMLGQIITTFAAPALCIFGIIFMIDFGKKL